MSTARLLSVSSTIPGLTADQRGDVIRLRGAGLAPRTFDDGGVFAQIACGGGVATAAATTPPLEFLNAPMAAAMLAQAIRRDTCATAEVTRDRLGGHPSADAYEVAVR